jgi:bifunctional non-homologous end joining protein LigD
MLATLAEPPLRQPGLVYEPKYDGIRALVHVDGDNVRIWSRLGNEKTTQFPVVVAALRRWGARIEKPVLLDGELVALDEQRRPAGFQRLQGRIHLASAKDVERIERQQPVALIAFDVLRDGDEDLRGQPLTERRARLEKLWKARGAGASADVLRISEQAVGDGHTLHERALQEGWEGLIVKDARSPYQSGRRSPAWRKLKVVQQQEFVVGGWTEPRQTRQFFGALLLGVPEGGALKYVGHTGTGFDGKELERVAKRLKALEIPKSPFSERIKTNEPAHWVRPDVVAQVRFTEWTADGKLRHPVYLGLRDDKKASEVSREEIPEPASESRRERPATVSTRPPSDARQERRATESARPASEAKPASPKGAAPKAR